MNAPLGEAQKMSPLFWSITYRSSGRVVSGSMQLGQPVVLVAVNLPCAFETQASVSKLLLLTACPAKAALHLMIPPASLAAAATTRDSHLTAFLSVGTVPPSSLSPKGWVPPQKKNQPVSMRRWSILGSAFARQGGQAAGGVNAGVADCSQPSSSKVLFLRVAAAAFTWHAASLAIVLAAAFAYFTLYFA